MGRSYPVGAPLHYALAPPPDYRRNTGSRVWAGRSVHSAAHPSLHMRTTGDSANCPLRAARSWGPRPRHCRTISAIPPQAVFPSVTFVGDETAQRVGRRSDMSLTRLGRGGPRPTQARARRSATNTGSSAEVRATNTGSSAEVRDQHRLERRISTGGQRYDDETSPKQPCTIEPLEGGWLRGYRRIC